ncbi:hypothetical protein BR63_03485 [Thermanaerosceptrum fracticalcis]|jgi:hypothetical protein|uniref:Uncharacterized protein n=1 Tax=Thermanaerosceptrum fracticalcis TaxID=1712410 RepID=A0A7G6E059_THEFR|nr:hypothetical protein [Thermanaerosceptrum fracticalcis]QNB45463.1 hypothetical protein BR63_03485 [Thermanaerosceptrum fracticalcis]
MTGKELVKMIIATDTFGRFVILQAPEYVKYFLDGEAYCENNYFDRSTLPTESGVYEAECEIYWDDGTSYYGEPNDPDWQISVVSYRLLPLETVNGKESPICPQCGITNLPQITGLQPE